MWAGIKRTEKGEEEREALGSGDTLEHRKYSRVKSNIFLLDTGLCFPYGAVLHTNDKALPCSETQYSDGGQGQTAAAVLFQPIRYYYCTILTKQLNGGVLSLVPFGRIASGDMSVPGIKVACSVRGLSLVN
ncbi:unnamed protein product [Discosporangium mesarthrocarpum]